MFICPSFVWYNWDKKNERLFEQPFIKHPIIKSKTIGDEMKALEKSFNLRPISLLWLNLFRWSVKLSVKGSENKDTNVNLLFLMNLLKISSARRMGLVALIWSCIFQSCPGTRWVNLHWKNRSFFCSMLYSVCMILSSFARLFVCCMFVHSSVR